MCFSAFFVINIANAKAKPLEYVILKRFKPLGGILEAECHYGKSKRLKSVAAAVLGMCELAI